MMLLDLRKALRGLGDPDRALAMRAYMKSEMPYHGIPAPLLRRMLKDTFADVQFTDARHWQRQVLELWRNARFREERYAAIHLAGHRQARTFQNPSALKLYEELVVTGAWWDYVDTIAAHRVGPILREYPGVMRRRMLTWSRSADLWKRRTAILCQLGSGARTDPDLLFGCIEPSLGSSEFFLRKAIGWALRQHARKNPDDIRRYVRQQGDRLSPLSRREALKHIAMV